MSELIKPTPEWYAVHVKSRHEAKVNERLILKGVESFLPTVERLRKWKDRKKKVQFPLFPGYLFVHTTSEADNLLSVLKVAGVVRMICTIPGRPDPIPDEQIISLQKLIENKEELDPYPYLNEGQQVRITRGALAGVEGILVKKLDKHLLVLSVDVLQQGVALKISASEVEKV
ncbi:MAG: UpxY family transcription antiterminator [Nitrospiraceae bacterium]|jgi:transcription antitermination factor NusG|nr:MAG: UpxY family transcription antiterminator [Nitrospiraceae bacterium]